MKRITFKFKDQYTKGNWKTQRCTVKSVDECIRIYGLDEPGVEYEIVSVEEVE